jgi:hypothetical protein
MLCPVWNEIVAAGKNILAAEIVQKISAARGTAGSQVTPTARTRKNPIKKWHVTGGSGPMQGKDVTLSMGEGLISVRGASSQIVEIPARNVLSAYHFFPENVEKRQRIQKWESGWDKVCEKTAGAARLPYPVGSPDLVGWGRDS